MTNSLRKSNNLISVTAENDDIRQMAETKILFEHRSQKENGHRPLYSSDRGLEKTDQSPFGR